MADDAETKGKMMRPNDLCTAAYYGDLKKIKELLTLPTVEEEPPIDPEFDPLAAPDTEAEESAAERATQRAQNAAELTKRLQTDGPLITRLSLVNIKTFGFGTNISESELRLSVKFKASRNCPDVASPLHWAVLGKEHEVIEHLVLEGADTANLTPELKVSIFDVVEKNDYRQTAKVLRKAIVARQARVAAEKDKNDKRQAILDERAEARRKALEEQQRKEEEERRAEEEAARAEEEAARAEEEATAAAAAEGAEGEEE